MKKILLFFGIILFNIIVYAKGSVELSKESITIDIGKTEEIEVLADNVAGLIDVKSLDTSIAVVDQENYFFDTTLNDNKVTLKITGKKAGKTNVEVNLADVSTFDEEVLSGTKTIEVIVSENKKEETPSNIVYYVIGGIVLIILCITVISIFRKRKNY